MKKQLNPNELFQEFLSINAVQDNIALSKAPSSMWINKGKEFALKTFHIAAEKVPAYKKFLQKNSIDHTKVRTFENYTKVPTTDKESYLMKYPLNELCLNGDISKANIISSSSASSGNPFYWPRLVEQDLSIARVLEVLYVNNFSIQSKSTLVLITLGMGVWTAGEMMFSSAKLISQKGHPMTVMSPGINLDEILKILKNVAPFYEQTFIIGYPAFVKDIIDSANNELIDLKSLKLKTLVGGEVFTESWREYIQKNAKMSNKYMDITSVLGSSEGGIVGIETPLSVYIRKQIYKKPKINFTLFNSEKIPSVVQFNPMNKFIEQVNKELVLTNLGGLPLIRYNTKDFGGVLSFDAILEGFNKEGIDKEEINQEIKQGSIWTLPFAYLFGRSNVMATIYAVNVYPENIKPALLDNKMKGQITSRFAMRTIEDKNKDQCLEIYIELGKGKKAKDIMVKELHELIIKNLKKSNSEFNKLNETVSRSNLIKINLKSFQDQQYFTSDKQKYVINK